MKIALILSIIGLICSLCFLTHSMKNNNVKMGLFSFISMFMFIFSTLFCVAKLNENPDVKKYSTIRNVISVNVDSVFTKTETGVDTTYNVHYKIVDYYKSLMRSQTNIKHIKVDTVFTKTTKDVDTTYVINYSRK